MQAEKTLRDHLIQLGQDLQEQDEFAFNLWVLLPSGKAAKEKDKNTYSNLFPGIKAVLMEAVETINQNKNFV